MDDTLHLPAEVTIYTVTELQPLCMRWIVDGGDAAGSCGLSIHADAVAEIDGAGLQLLLALARSAALQNRRLEFVEPSHAFIAACNTLGATVLLTTSSPEPQGIAS